MDDLSSLIGDNGIPNTFAVRGVTKEPFRSRIKLLRSGMPVSLEPEPHNPHDPNAIKVIARTGDDAIQIGYVPREVNVVIGEIISGASQHWSAHISELMKLDSGDAVGVLVMFCCNEALPRQESKVRPSDDVG